MPQNHLKTGDEVSETIYLRPLNRNFSVNKMTGEVSGLMWVTGITLVDGDRKLPFDISDHSWLEVSIHDGQWSPHFKIVTAKDFPTSNYEWSQFQNILIKTDSKGNKHLLLVGREQGFWKARLYMNYLVEDNNNWSAPLTLGSSAWSHEGSLAVDDSGVAFAAWVNQEGKFIGRWIRPSRIDLE